MSPRSQFPPAREVVRERGPRREAREEPADGEESSATAPMAPMAEREVAAAAGDLPPPETELREGVGNTASAASRELMGRIHRRRGLERMDFKVRPAVGRGDRAEAHTEQAVPAAQREASKAAVVGAVEPEEFSPEMVAGPAAMRHPRRSAMDSWEEAESLAAGEAVAAIPGVDRRYPVVVAEEPARAAEVAAVAVAVATARVAAAAEVAERHSRLAAPRVVLVAMAAVAEPVAKGVTVEQEGRAERAEARLKSSRWDAWMPGPRHSSRWAAQVMRAWRDCPAWIPVPTAKEGSPAETWPTATRKAVTAVMARTEETARMVVRVAVVAAAVAAVGVASGWRVLSCISTGLSKST